MDFVCPSCQSDNIQRLSVIFEGGLSDINTKTKGTALGIGRGGIGVGVGASKTTGTSQTAASKRAAPPAKKGYLKPLLGIFGIFFLVSMFLGGKSEIVGGVVTVGWLAASAGWIYHAFQYNGKVWPSLKATWDNSFLCNRCNEMFCLGN
mgnify:CR=1 FL=1|jgi:hypothetical protein